MEEEGKRSEQPVAVDAYSYNLNLQFAGALGIISVVQSDLTPIRSWAEERDLQKNLYAAGVDFTQTATIQEKKNIITTTHTYIDAAFAYYGNQITKERQRLRRTGVVDWQRVRRVVELHYGLSGEAPMTFRDIAKDPKVGRSASTVNTINYCYGLRSLNRYATETLEGNTAWNALLKKVNLGQHRVPIRDLLLHQQLVDNLFGQLQPLLRTETKHARRASAIATYDAFQALGFAKGDSILASFIFLHTYFSLRGHNISGLYDLAEEIQRGYVDGFPISVQEEARQHCASLGSLARQLATQVFPGGGNLPSVEAVKILRDDAYGDPLYVQYQKTEEGWGELVRKWKLQLLADQL